MAPDTAQSSRRIIWTAGIALMLWLVLGPSSKVVEAAMRFTEGTFKGCFYGNRGGFCTYWDDRGQEQELPMPYEPAKALQWYIDGKPVKYRHQDGDFLVPNHPAFAEDHDGGADVQERGIGHPFHGCSVRIV